MKRLLGSIAVAVAACCAPLAAADATTITTTWTGTMMSGSDDAGFFGGGPLSGSMKLVTVFDTDHGTHGNAFGSDFQNGGGSAVLTINGIDFIFHGSSDLTTAYVKNPINYGVSINETNGDLLALTFFTHPSPASILAAFSTTCVSGSCAGLFSISGGQTHGEFSLSAMNVAIGTVPLPAALPLFAAALGGLGVMGWRRKQQASVVLTARFAG